MKFEPLALILKRVKRYGSDSDSILFTELLYAGEFVVKVTTAAFVSLIEDDNDNQRYQLLHRLVRTNGLGDLNMSERRLFSSSSATPVVAFGFLAIEQQGGDHRQRIAPMTAIE